MGQRTRIMAVDPGERRIGIALSDPLGTIANPLETIKWNGEDRTKADARIAALVEEHGVAELVVGLPRRTDGRPGPGEERSRTFAEEMARRLPIPVTLLDERYTSVIAGRILRETGARTDRREGAVDRMAAAVLLQDYLESKRR